MPLFPYSERTQALIESAGLARESHNLDALVQNSTRHMLKHLLHDATQSLQSSLQEQPTRWAMLKKFLRRFGLFLIVLAGTVGVICEAMDGVSSIVALIGLEPFTILLIAASIMLLAIVLFVINSLPDIAKMLHLEVNFAHNPDDEQYALQKQFGNLLDASVQENKLADPAWRRLVNLAQARITALQAQLQHHAPRWWHQVLANVFPIVALLVSFCGGFCAGQTLALLIGGFFVASLTPLHLPILLACVFAGLLTATAFGLSQYGNLRAQIIRAFGFDEEKHGSLEMKKTKHDNRLKISLSAIPVHPLSSSNAQDVPDPPSSDGSPGLVPASAGVFQW